MDVQIDCVAIHYGLKQIKNSESALSDFSSAMSGITLPSELSTASLLDDARTTISNYLSGDILELIEIFEESKSILAKNDNHAALLFAYCEQGIIDESGRFTDVPLMNQDDYGYIPYSQGSVATSGCGITSFCMLASYMTGNLYTPEDLAGIANTNRQSNVGKMLTAAEHLNINWINDTNTSAKDLVNYLQDGKMVICLVKDSSHFVLCKGITADGKILVNDPYSPFRSSSFADGYTLNELDFSVGNTWVFDPNVNTNAKTSAGTVSISSSLAKKLQNITIDGNYTETVRADEKREKNSYNPENFSSPNQRYIKNAIGSPCLLQTDNRWSNYRMMAGNTINDSGCGYTSLSMILSGLNQEEITPQEIISILKAETDTNGDGRGEYYDRNQDGSADIYDALSKSRDGNDGLKLDAVVSDEFAEIFGVKVESIHVGSDGDKYGIQDAVDDGKPCLIGTPGHYLTVVPGVNTYTDQSGASHNTIVLIDPYDPNNTVELYGDFNYDTLAAAGVTSLYPQEMSVHTIEKDVGKIPAYNDINIPDSYQVVQLSNQNQQSAQTIQTTQTQQQVTQQQTQQQVSNPTSTQQQTTTNKWQNVTTQNSTSQNNYSSNNNYSTPTYSSGSTNSSSNNSTSTNTNQTITNNQTNSTPETPIINTKPSVEQDKVEVEIEKPTIDTNTKPEVPKDEPPIKKPVELPKVDHSTSTNEAVLEQLKPTISTTPDSTLKEENSNITTNPQIEQVPPKDNNVSIPDTKVDKPTTNKGTEPIINPAFIGAALATLSVGAVTISEIKKDKKKDNK